jgi:hypothetical protein
MESKVGPARRRLDGGAELKALWAKGANKGSSRFIRRELRGNDTGWVQKGSNLRRLRYEQSILPLNYEPRFLPDGEAIDALV